MPLYVYEIIQDDGSSGERFEVFQKMSDKAARRCTGDRKAGQARRDVGEHRRQLVDAATKQKLNNKNLDRLGFTKYEQAGDGHYEKKAEQGPDAISAD